MCFQKRSCHGRNWQSFRRSPVDNTKSLYPQSSFWSLLYYEESKWTAYISFIVSVEIVTRHTCGIKRVISRCEHAIMGSDSAIHIPRQCVIVVVCTLWWRLGAWLPLSGSLFWVFVDGTVLAWHLMYRNRKDLIPSTVNVCRRRQVYTKGGVHFSWGVVYVRSSLSRDDVWRLQTDFASEWFFFTQGCRFSSVLGLGSGRDGVLRSQVSASEWFFYTGLLV